MVGSIHRPELSLFGPGLVLLRTVEVPFPSAAQIMALGKRPELATPAPGVLWLPRFLSGLACDDRSIFALLALPVPEIVELGLDGTVRTIRAASEGTFRRLDGLSRDLNGRWYTLAWTEGRQGAVLRITMDSSSGR